MLNVKIDIKEGDKMLSSKEVADMFNISASTIRYYEKIGIIPPIKRDEKGYRIYNNSALNWIYLMKSLRNAGLSIESLREFSRLSQKEGDERKQQKLVLKDQLEKIDEKIAELEDVRKLLDYKIDIFDDHLAKFQTGELDGDNVEKLWKVDI